MRQQTPQIRLLGLRETAAGGQALRGRMETDIRSAWNQPFLGSSRGSLCLCPCLSGPQCDTLELTQKIIIAPAEAMSGVLIIDPCKAPCLGNTLHTGAYLRSRHLGAGGLSEMTAGALHRRAGTATFGRPCPGAAGGSVRWTGSKWEGRRLIGRGKCYSTLPLTHGGAVDGWLPGGAEK